MSLEEDMEIEEANSFVAPASPEFHPEDYARTDGITSEDVEMLKALWVIALRCVEMHFRAPTIPDIFNALIAETSDPSMDALESAHGNSTHAEFQDGEAE